jgi:hypothetical protein
MVQKFGIGAPNFGIRKIIFEEKILQKSPYPDFQK